MNEYSKIPIDPAVMVRRLQPTPDGMPPEINASRTEADLEIYDAVMQTSGRIPLRANDWPAGVVPTPISTPPSS